MEATMTEAPERRDAVIQTAEARGLLGAKEHQAGSLMR
jgi:hypothetical protein